MTRFVSKKEPFVLYVMVNLVIQLIYSLIGIVTLSKEIIKLDI
jgi:hypothetical protein